jgi:hypothetical protein
MSKIRKGQKVNNLVHIHRHLPDVMERKVWCYACGFMQTLYMSRLIKSENMCCPNPNCHSDGSIWFLDTRK